MTTTQANLPERTGDTPAGGRRADPYATPVGGTGTLARICSAGYVVLGQTGTPR